MAKTHIRRDSPSVLNSNYRETACGQTGVPSGYALMESEFRNAVVAEYGGDNRRRLHPTYLCSRCVRIALKEMP